MVEFGAVSSNLYQERLILKKGRVYIDWSISRIAKKNYPLKLSIPHPPKKILNIQMILYILLSLDTTYLLFIIKLIILRNMKHKKYLCLNILNFLWTFNFERRFMPQSPSRYATGGIDPSCEAIFVGLRRAVRRILGTLRRKHFLSFP